MAVLSTWSEHCQRQCALSEALALTAGMHRRCLLAQSFAALISYMQHKHQAPAEMQHASAYWQRRHAAAALWMWRHQTHAQAQLSTAIADFRQRRQMRMDRQRQSDCFAAWKLKTAAQCSALRERVASLERRRLARVFRAWRLVLEAEEVEMVAGLGQISCSISAGLYKAGLVYLTHYTQVSNKTQVCEHFNSL